jgi:hypothetical protein
MKSILSSVVLVIVMAVSTIAAQGIEGTQNGPREPKGYVTIGNSLLVLPTQLRAGDLIEFTNVNGATVFAKRVGDGFFHIDVSRLHTGLYLVSLKRNGARIAAMSLPLKSR